MVYQTSINRQQQQVCVCVYGGRGAQADGPVSQRVCRNIPPPQGLHPATIASVSCTPVIGVCRTVPVCRVHTHTPPSPASSVTHLSTFYPSPPQNPPSLPSPLKSSLPSPPSLPPPPPSQTFPAAPVCRQARAVLAGTVQAVCAAQDRQPLRVIRQLQGPLDVQLYQLQGGRRGRAGRAGEVCNNNKKLVTAAAAAGHRMTALDDSTVCKACLLGTMN